MKNNGVSRIDANEKTNYGNSFGNLVELDTTPMVRSVNDDDNQRSNRLMTASFISTTTAPSNQSASLNNQSQQNKRRKI